MVNRTLLRGLDAGVEEVDVVNVNDDELNEYISQDSEPQRDSIVEGKVMRVEKDFVVVDVGSKSEGLIPRSEWEENEKAPEPGDIVKVLVEDTEDTMSNEDVATRGMITLSKRKAARIEAWNRMMAEVQEGKIVEGEVIKKIKEAWQ